MPEKAAHGGDWEKLTVAQKRLMILWLVCAGLVGFGLAPRLLSPRPQSGEVTFRPTGGLAVNKGETVSFALPQNWTAIHNGHQPFREATFFDATGKGCVEFTVDVLPNTGPDSPKTLEAFIAQSKANKWQPLENAQWRQTGRGKLWWAMTATSQAADGRVFVMDKKSPRGVRPKVVVGAEQWSGKVLVWKFRVLPDQVRSLEADLFAIMERARLTQN